MNAKRIHIPTARNRGEMISKLNAKGNKVWHGFKDPNVVYIGRG
jgi:hypothetical protein